MAPATRDRILVAARELNYYPNVLARSMKQRSGLTIGLIVGNICNSFFSTVVRAIESTVFRHGYKVIVCNTDESIEMELIHARALMEHRVDGIIVSPTANEKGEVSRATKEIYGKQVRTVIFDRAVKGVKLPIGFSRTGQAGN